MTAPHAETGAQTESSAFGPDGVPSMSASARQSPASRRLRGDTGQIGGFEVLPFGFLLFVSVTLLLVNVWGVIDAKLAVTSAAREAARVYSESDDESSARLAAVARATETLTAYGRGGQRGSIDVPVLPRLERCARLTVTVSYEVPGIAVPFLGGLGTRTVSSSFTEIVDPYRDRIDGDARC